MGTEAEKAAGTDAERAGRPQRPARVRVCINTSVEAEVSDMIDEIASSSAVRPTRAAVMRACLELGARQLVREAARPPAPEAA